MKNRRLAYGFVAAFIVPLLILIIWPPLDLLVSGLFYKPDEGFPLANNKLCEILHLAGSRGAWIFGGWVAVVTAIAAERRAKIFGMDAKAWLFLLLALMIGPVLIANVILKDHWGRARPDQISEFGGTELFSSAILPQPVKRPNGSFIAGDPAFGFYLTSIAYIIPENRRRNRSRIAFWLGILAGVVLGATRLVMGGHFLSDILFAAVFMFGASAWVYAGMYGPGATKACWRNWLLLGGTANKRKAK